MKITEVDQEYMINYLRLDAPEESVKKEVDAAMDSAKAYIRSYTGLEDEEINENEDITVAFMVLVADMFENKSYYLDYKSKETNKTVDAILGMHSKNLI